MRLSNNSTGFGSATGIVTTIETEDNNISLLIDARRLKKYVSFSFTNSFSNDYEAGYSGPVIHANSFYMFNTAQQVAHETG